MALSVVSKTFEIAHRLNAFVEFECNPTSASGPLNGLTYAIKDLVEVSGRAPTCGLAQPPFSKPARTAPVISTIESNGAARRGFTEMTPLAYEPSGGNPYRPRPVNSWNPARICGGSSSGSAVAVAAGLVDFALGTDTAGSVRIPAHCCGVVSWKPSYALIDASGTMPLAPSLDTIGFFARSAQVLTRLQSVVAPGLTPSELRCVAIAHDCISWAGAARAIASVEKALAALGIGVCGTQIGHLLHACDEPVLTLLQGEAAISHRQLIDAGGLEPTLAKRLERGLAITGEQCADARAKLAALAKEPLELAFAGADALLMPVLRGPTPTVDQCEPGSASFSGRTLYALTELARFVNGLRLPAVTLPAAMDDDGMPVAVQIVSRPGSDRALLGLASAIEARRQQKSFIPPIAIDQLETKND